MNVVSMPQNAAIRCSLCLYKLKLTAWQSAKSDYFFELPDYNVVQEW